MPENRALVGAGLGGTQAAGAVQRDARAAAPVKCRFSER